MPSVAFPEQIAWTEGRSHGEIASWLASERERIGASLAACGALLVRGLPPRGAAAFDAFVVAFSGLFGLRDYSYAQSQSNAVRIELTSRVFTANEAPSTALIALHHELAQTPHFPTHLFFHCDRAADRGGETTLCDSVALLTRLAALRPEFVRACQSRGLRYTTWMPASDDARSGQGRSWRRTFAAASVEQAEAAMRRLGYRWDWLADGWLRATSPVLPAIAPASGGRSAFFNQLIAAWLGWQSRADGERPVAFGDDSPIDDADVRVAAEIAESVSIDVAWRAGDIACLDNRAVMHGRRPFAGERRVWAAFATEA